MGPVDLRQLSRATGSGKWQQLGSRMCQGLLRFNGQRPFSRVRVPECPSDRSSPTGKWQPTMLVRFEAGEKLGKGSFGTVFLATDRGGGCCRFCLQVCFRAATCLTSSHMGRDSRSTASCNTSLRLERLSLFLGTTSDSALRADSDAEDCDGQSQHRGW